LDADEAVHLVRACPGALGSMAASDVTAAFGELNAQAASVLGRSADIVLERQADLRFRGQSTALTVPVPSVPADRRGLQALGRAFSDEHARTYGYAPEREPIGLVNVRVIAQRETPRTGLVALASQGAGHAEAEAPAGGAGTRRAFFGDGYGWLETPLLARRDLRDGCDGPLIVEEYD